MQNQGDQHPLLEAVYFALGVSGEQQPPYVGVSEAGDAIEQLCV